MPLDLEAKQSEGLDAAQELAEDAPVADSAAGWSLDGAGALFIQKFRALVDAASAIGDDVSQDEYALLRKEYLALGATERYAVQSSLSGTYSSFASFDSDDYNSFVA